MRVRLGLWLRTDKERTEAQPSHTRGSTRSLALPSPNPDRGQP